MVLNFQIKPIWLSFLPLRRHDLRNALTVIRPAVKINLRRHREAVHGDECTGKAIIVGQFITLPLFWAID